ncbi:MAG: RICIN domain-containing protein [Parashewanella sp.]
MKKINIFKGALFSLALTGQAYAAGVPDDPDNFIRFRSLLPFKLHVCIDPNGRVIESEGRGVATRRYLRKGLCLNAGGKYTTINPATTVDLPRAKRSLILATNTVTGHFRTGLSPLDNKFCGGPLRLPPMTCGLTGDKLKATSITFVGGWFFPFPFIDIYTHTSGPFLDSVQPGGITGVPAKDFPTSKIAGNDIFFYLREHRVGKCLEVKKQTESDNKRIVASKCNGDVRQQWRYLKNTQQLQNRSLGLCLNVEGQWPNGNGSLHGRGLFVRSCSENPTPNARVTMKNNEVYFDNPNRGVMDMAGEHNGAHVIIHGKNNQAQQVWNAIAANSPITTKWYQMLSPGTKKCLSYAGASQKVIQETCTANQNQLWHYDPLSNKLINKTNNQCVTIDNGTYHEGNTLSVKPCLDHTAAQFEVGAQRFVGIDNTGSRLSPIFARDLSFTADKNNGNVTLQSYPSENTQLKSWVPVFVKGPTVPAYYANLRDSWSGKCIDIPSANPNANKLILYTCHSGDNQQWHYDLTTRQLKSKMPNICMSYNKLNGRFVPLRCHSTAPEQKFTRTPKGTFHSDLDINAVIDATGTENGALIKRWGANGGLNQRFFEIVK